MRRVLEILRLKFDWGLSDRAVAVAVSVARSTVQLCLGGDPTLADGILDHIVHNAHRIQLRGGSLRRKRTQENAKA